MLEELGRTSLFRMEKGDWLMVGDMQEMLHHGVVILEAHLSLAASSGPLPSDTLTKIHAYKGSGDDYWYITIVPYWHPHYLLFRASYLCMNNVIYLNIWRKISLTSHPCAFSFYFTSLTMIICDCNHNPKVDIRANADLIMLKSRCPYFNWSKIDSMSFSTLTPSYVQHHQSLITMSRMPGCHSKLCKIEKGIYLLLFPPFVTIDMSSPQHSQFIVSPMPDPQPTTSPNATHLSTPILALNPAPYHPSTDINLEDDSDKEELMQPPAHERVKVTKAASAASKIMTQLNKAKCKKFDTSMVKFGEAIEKLVTAVAVEHGYKNQYVTKLLNHTMNHKTSRLPNLENAKVHMKTVELNTSNVYDFISNINILI